MKPTRLFAGIALALLVLFSTALSAQAQAADPPDYAVANGWYYTQTGGGTGRGYAITDNGGIAFWTGFQQLGGEPALGPPVSGRFILNGFVYQATQKALLQWDAANNRVNIANAYDILSAAGYDAWLAAHRQIPESFNWSADDPINDWPGTVQNHISGIFEAQPGDTPEISAARAAIRDRFLSNPDWLAHFGLPMAIQDFGPMIVMRAQRVAMQYWKIQTAWGANVGDVTQTLTGDIFKESGLIPEAATVPLDAAAASADGAAPPGATVPTAGQQTPPPPPPPPPPGIPVDRILADSVVDQLAIVGPPSVIASPHGNLRVYLRLRNDSNTIVSSAVEVTVLNAGGGVIGQASGDVYALLPGSTRAVRLISSDPFAEAASLELRFSGTLVGGADHERAISIGDPHYSVQGNLHVLRGSVTNTGSRPYSLDLGGALLDAAGGVTGMATGIIVNLLPGETKTYMLYTTENVQGVASYNVGVNVIIPK